MIPGDFLTPDRGDPVGRRRGRRYYRRGVGRYEGEDSANSLMPSSENAPENDRTLFDHQDGLSDMTAFEGLPPEVRDAGVHRLSSDSVAASQVSNADANHDVTRFDPEPPQFGPEQDVTRPGATLPPSEVTEFGEGSHDATDAGVDRTHYAMAAVELGTRFKHKFALAKFGISPRYGIELRDPDGPSTAQGSHARQSLVLYREGHRGGRAVVLGWFDASTRQAKLRTYQVLSEYHLKRFKRPFDLVESEYARMADEVRRFADTQGFMVRIIRSEPALAGRTEDLIAPPPRTISLHFIVLGLLVVLGLGVALGYLMRGV